LGVSRRRDEGRASPAPPPNAQARRAGASPHPPLTPNPSLLTPLSADAAAALADAVHEREHLSDGGVEVAGDDATDTHLFG
jgi:hypothetical protein